MITRKTIHKIFEPLQITVSTVVGGEAVQLYDSILSKWTPDRTVTGKALTIQPKVVATTSATDSSWENKDYISAVRDFDWYVNGTPIGQIEALRGKYSIDTSGGGTNGRLTLTANLSAGTHYDFVFKGYFSDTRNATSVRVQTDPVPVTVSEVAGNEWDLSVVHDTSIKYKPLSDRLKEYDWKVANGIIAASTTERNKCLDGNQYLLTMPIMITCGVAKVNSSHKYWNKIAMHLYVITAENETLADDAIFVSALTKEKLTIDQRLIPDGTVLRLSLVVNGVECGSEYMTFSLVIDKYSCEPTNEGDYNGTDTIRQDTARCMNLSAGRPMRYPEAYLKMEWYTDSQNAEGVYHGEGGHITMKYSDINIGSNHQFDVYIKSNIKAQAALITVDKDGNIIITNEDGDVLTADLLLLV